MRKAPRSAPRPRPGPRPLATLAVLALVVSAGCVGVSLGGGTATPTVGDEATVEVVRVVDGDTVEVQFPDGRRDTVRLLGVDTPEVHAEVAPDEYEGVPDTEAGRACLRDWGERASDYATGRLAGREVTLAFDPQSDRRGGYDRLLAYVRVDGESFNRALLAGGYARVYDSRFVERDAYDGTEADARDANRGLWTCRDP